MAAIRTTRSPGRTVSGLATAITLAILISCADHQPDLSGGPTSTTTTSEGITAVTGLPAPPTLDLSGLPGVSVVTMPDCWIRVSAEAATLGFEKDSSELPDDEHGRATLAEIFEMFRGAKQVQVHGHASTEGHPGRNDTLARERAEAVAAAGRRALPGVDFVAYGHGATSTTVVEGDNEELRAKNRRVELYGQVERCD